MTSKPDLARLFRLLELTRSQPQTGYALYGLPKLELSDLAQHHYLVTAFAWQLAKLDQKAGGKINMERVLEICLVHDLGELFGGDIAMPYAKANPKAKAAAKDFEHENQLFLTREFFGDDSAELFELAMNLTSDEARLAKIADYMEVTHYKLQLRRLTAGDITMAHHWMIDFLKGINDQKTKQSLADFVDRWSKALQEDSSTELFESAKTN